MSDWYTERRQNQELEELRSEMSLAMSEASRLRSRVSQLQGSLDSRLRQLTDAFDAFVELSDIRYELIGFADAAEVRRHAGQVLTALASAKQPPAAGPEVPGYWLQPAVAALHGPTADATELPAGPLSKAMSLDEHRTSAFLCLALAALGRRDLVRTTWLDTAFGTPADGQVTRLQRVLWSTGARGGLGADGLTLIVARLREQVKGLSWLETVVSRARPGSLTGPDFKEITTARNARARLGQLRAAVETIAGHTAVREPDSNLAANPTRTARPPYCGCSSPKAVSPNAGRSPGWPNCGPGSPTAARPRPARSPTRWTRSRTCCGPTSGATTSRICPRPRCALPPATYCPQDRADAANQIARMKEATAESAAALAAYKADARDREKAVTADLEAIRQQLA